VSEQVVIDVVVNTQAAEAQIAAVEDKIDSTIERWRANRQEIMLGLSALNQVVAITAKIASKTADEVGKGMLKILQSLLSVVNSTVSAMIAVAAGYAATGIGIPIAAAVAAFAAGLSIGQQIVIIGVQLLADMENVKSRLSTVESQANFRAYMGGF
jgi:membrane-associated protease RseP (regulator of RpoE activity)